MNIIDYNESPDKIHYEYLFKLYNDTYQHYRHLLRKCSVSEKAFHALTRSHVQEKLHGYYHKQEKEPLDFIGNAFDIIREYRKHSKDRQIINVLKKHFKFVKKGNVVFQGIVSNYNCAIYCSNDDSVLNIEDYDFMVYGINFLPIYSVKMQSMPYQIPFYDKDIDNDLKKIGLFIDQTIRLRC